MTGLRDSFCCCNTAQEILDNHVRVKDDMVVHVWKWWWPVDMPPGGAKPPLGLFARKQGRGHAIEPQQRRRASDANHSYDDVAGWVYELERVTKQVRVATNSPWCGALGHQLSISRQNFSSLQLQPQLSL